MLAKLMIWILIKKKMMKNTNAMSRKKKHQCIHNRLSPSAPAVESKNVYNNVHVRSSEGILNDDVVQTFAHFCIMISIEDCRESHF